MPIEKIPLEGGGFAVDPVALINAADNDICHKITLLFPDGIEPITLLSTLSRVMGYVCARGAPSFDSIEDGVRLTQFMILTNARIAWEMHHPEERPDGHRVN